MCPCAPSATQAAADQKTAAGAHRHQAPSTSATRQSGRMLSVGGASRVLSLRISPSASAGQGGEGLVNPQAVEQTALACAASSAAAARTVLAGAQPAAGQLEEAGAHLQSGAQAGASQSRQENCGRLRRRPARPAARGGHPACGAQQQHNPNTNATASSVIHPQLRTRLQHQHVGVPVLVHHQHRVHRAAQALARIPAPARQGLAVAFSGTRMVCRMQAAACRTSWRCSRRAKAATSGISCQPPSAGSSPSLLLQPLHARRHGAVLLKLGGARAKGVVGHRVHRELRHGGCCGLQRRAASGEGVSGSGGGGGGGERAAAALGGATSHPGWPALLTLRPGRRGAR